MATVAAPAPPSAGQLDFASFKSGDITGMRDPLRRVARAMAALSAAQAVLLGTMTDTVKLNTDHMARVNAAMKILNKALGENPTKKDEESCTLYTGKTKAECDSVVAQFTAEGIASSLFTVATASPFTITVTKANMTSASKNLQLVTDDMSSTNQQDQLSLQTMLGRYNGTFEVVTSTIKKHETQGESVNANLKN